MPDLHRITILWENGEDTVLNLRNKPTMADYYRWIETDMVELQTTPDSKLEIIMDENGKAISMTRKEDRPTNHKACDLLERPYEGLHRIVGTVVVQAKGTLE